MWIVEDLERREKGHRGVGGLPRGIMYVSVEIGNKNRKRQDKMFVYKYIITMEHTNYDSLDRRC